MAEEQNEDAGNNPNQPPEANHVQGIFNRLYIGRRNTETPDGIPPIDQDYFWNNILWVGGGIVAGDLFMVTVDRWADHVFDDDYELEPLDRVEEFIEEHKHLPGEPSADNLKQDGASTTDLLLATLMRKVEELTLYTIQQEKRIKDLEAMVHNQNSVEVRDE